MAKNKGILKTLAVGVLAVGVIGAGIGTAYHLGIILKIGLITSLTLHYPQHLHPERMKMLIIHRAVYMLMV